MKTQQIGNHGEQVAQEYLLQQGYQILETNYRCKMGEIDIIAKDGNTLVFVEVRSRSSTQYGSPLDTINRTKQQKIRKAAEHFLFTKRKQNAYCRFDVVAIVWTDDHPQIQLIKNAFA